MSIIKNESGIVVVTLGEGDVIITSYKDFNESPKLEISKSNEVRKVGEILSEDIELNKPEVVIEFKNKKAVTNMMMHLSRICGEDLY